MDDAIKFQKIAAISAITSAPLALLSVILPLAAVDFDLRIFSDTMMYLYTGDKGAVLWRWGMVLDIFGYYLLMIPLNLFLWRWLRTRGENKVTLFTVLILFYSLIGAIGASILASVLPPIISSYPLLSPAEQETSKALFTFSVNAVYEGLWNLLEELLAGVAWLGFGFILKKEFPAIGIVTIILGSGALLDSLGTIFNIELIAVIGLNIYIILTPVWSFWMGMILLKKKLVL